MPDARRQIWKIRVPRDVELTSLKNRNEQEQNKDDKKKWTKRNGESKEKWWKREMNKKTMKNDLSWNDPWLRSP